MTQEPFYHKVKRHFQGLVERHKLSVVHEDRYPESYGNSIVVLESDHCRIRVLLERGQVFLEVGPVSAPVDWLTSAPDLWFDLTMLTSFVCSGADRWEYALPEDGFTDEFTESELRRLASILERYYSQICELFSDEVFDQKQEELVQFEKLQAANTWGGFVARG